MLSALDDARTQRYHITATVRVGMGFLTVAYNLFCISAVSNLLGRLYYYNPDTGMPGKLPTPINNLVVVVALVGAFIGQLVFGCLGDKFGRKRVHGITLILMVVFAICSGLSGLPFGCTAKTVIGTLCFYRFCLGFAVGGNYPLSATLMSEYANKQTRGTFIAAVFAMQGVGIISAGLVPMICSHIFLSKYPAEPFYNEPILSTQPKADYLWRIVLMLGALPAMLTYYSLTRMPETGRYTAIIEGNAEQAADDMGSVLNMGIQRDEDRLEIQRDDDRLSQFRRANDYKLLSGEFFKRHGLHLIGTMSTWFLLDIAFYSQNLTQKDIFASLGLVKPAAQVNALREVFEISRAMCLVALLGTFPGYWVTVLFIEIMGRFFIQLLGFFMMSLFMVIMGINYENLKVHNPHLFAVFYALTFFFANFGPNSTTFVLPAELFPTRVRSTCHGLSAAAGKAGAIVGTLLVQTYTSDGNVDKIKHALMVLGYTNMLGFCCTFLVSETQGRSLEEISGEDGEDEILLVSETQGRSLEGISGEAGGGEAEIEMTSR